MAAKRKGGLKLNAICAKLSRQVVVEKRAEASSHAEGSPPRPWDQERSGPESGAARAPRSEEDKRRAVIEKWVNGEYSEEPVPTPVLGRIAREGLELPPEGVYMVQPQGCSDEEDHAEEPSKDGGALEEKDSDGAASKEDSGSSAKQAPAYRAQYRAQYLAQEGRSGQHRELHRPAVCTFCYLELSWRSPGQALFSRHSPRPPLPSLHLYAQPSQQDVSGPPGLRPSQCILLQPAAPAVRGPLAHLSPARHRGPALLVSVPWGSRAALCSFCSRGGSCRQGGRQDNSPRIWAFSLPPASFPVVAGALRLPCPLPEPFPCSEGRISSQCGEPCAAT
ncbi:hypothetical protein P7K49_015417 [Saguinus oedipus]|uniref:Uncharacterized protein n=1 Tax=Saguinus oedipus TaxID=9490 RepID=A0ABQ9V984_SAGOE|nr:hypothetical protein P7K49_015417 [Saguinus oedipus]